MKLQPASASQPTMASPPACAPKSKPCDPTPALGRTSISAAKGATAQPQLAATGRTCHRHGSEPRTCHAQTAAPPTANRSGPAVTFNLNGMA
jgi:hypothetical protein